MADIKITDLTGYASPATTDVLPIVDVGADITKKVTVSDLVSAGGLPTATTDGKALIVENGQWVEGPVIGGYSYTTGGGSSSSVYTVPTGFSLWAPEFATSDSNGTPAANLTLSNNNRTVTATANGTQHAISSTTKSSGKWYWEVRPTNINTDNWTGIMTDVTADWAGASGSGGIGFRQNGQGGFNDSGATYDYTGGNYLSWSANDVVMLAVDLDGKKIWYGVNGTWENSGDPGAGTGQMYSNWTGTPTFYFVHRVAFTNNSVDLVGYSSGGTTVSGDYTIDNLDDVDTSTAAPTDGQVLAWDNAASKWEPGSLRTLLGIGEYVDDAAAGTGGVASGSLYYNTTNSDYRLKS